jgi:hypothetical protein
VKLCAERATWLEQRRDPLREALGGPDIDSLKMLIKLTIHWIGSDLLTKQFEEAMPEDKKS